MFFSDFWLDGWWWPLLKETRNNIIFHLSCMKENFMYDLDYIDFTNSYLQIFYTRWLIFFFFITRIHNSHWWFEIIKYNVNTHNKHILDKSQKLFLPKSNYYFVSGYCTFVLFVVISVGGWMEFTNTPNTICVVLIIPIRKPSQTLFFLILLFT